MRRATLIEDLPGGALLITLTRPERKNAFNHQMWCGTRDALAEAQANDAVRVVVVTEHVAAAPIAQSRRVWLTISRFEWRWLVEDVVGAVRRGRVGGGHHYLLLRVGVRAISPRAWWQYKGRALNPLRPGDMCSPAGPRLRRGCSDHR
jgi:hypothetical protein